jgi:hypothetical protein
MQETTHLVEGIVDYELWVQGDLIEVQWVKPRR